MIENREDTLEIDFVLNIIKRQDWVDEEILLIYEDCYRRVRKMLILAGEDTKQLDETRNEIMKVYGQI